MKTALLVLVLSVLAIGSCYSQNTSSKIFADEIRYTMVNGYKITSIVYTSWGDSIQYARFFIHGKVYEVVFETHENGKYQWKYFEYDIPVQDILSLGDNITFNLVNESKPLFRQAVKFDINWFK